MAKENGRTPMRLGLIGFGDVGFGYAAGLRDEGLTGIAVYTRRSSALIQERADSSGVRLLRSPAEVAAEADLILSLTQGGEAVKAAEAIRDALRPHHLYVDLSSAIPRIKKQIGEVLASSGARVADGALVTSPLSDRHGILTIASGPGAREFHDLATPWGMRIEVVEGELGVASGIKLLRSIVIKCFEAALWECMLGASAYGIRDEMIEWTEHWFNRGFAENFQRLMRTGVIHARRRAEEAEMCAETLEDVGIKPVMTLATKELLNTIGDFELRESRGGRIPDTYQEALDVVEACYRAARSPR
jgi:3-hydroxyisobutyrate dehydrogenase-like beta-hydroxyacid dehydrogenase